MPINKRESLIYTIMMCFLMVLWMSNYNVMVHSGGISLETIKAAWMGFPIAYIYAMALDWFVVSNVAKKFSFKYLVKPESNPLKKIVAVSCCMVIPMVIFMSLYGAFEVCAKSGEWSQVGAIWLSNLPINFIMALPFQLIIAGPIVRRVFRKIFPVGKVLA